MDFTILTIKSVTYFSPISYTKSSMLRVVKLSVKFIRSSMSLNSVHHFLCLSAAYNRMELPIVALRCPLSCATYSNLGVFKLCLLMSIGKSRAVIRQDNLKFAKFRYIHLYTFVIVNIQPCPLPHPLSPILFNVQTASRRWSLLSAISEWYHEQFVRVFLLHVLYQISFSLDFHLNYFQSFRLCGILIKHYVYINNAPMKPEREIHLSDPTLIAVLICRKGKTL